MEFESDSYIVEKNEDIQAVIVIKYPSKYEPSIMFPIMIRVDEIDDTATGKLLLVKYLIIAQYLLYVYTSDWVNIDTHTV